MATIQDPQAALDYTYDWSAWLTAGETLASATVTTPPIDGGITVSEPTVDEDAATVTARISGGTLGESYAVVWHVVASNGEEDDRTQTFHIRNR